MSRGIRRTGSFIPYAEAVGGILILSAGLYWYAGTEILVNPRFHPFEMVVLLVAARYGFLAGTTTAIMAILTYYGVLLYRDGLSSVYPAEFSFLWPSVFLFSGMVLGEFHDDDRLKLTEARRQIDREREQVQTSIVRLEAQEKALSELEKRFLLQPETVSTLYDVGRSINMANMTSLPIALLTGIVRFSQVDAASIYWNRGAFWELSESVGTAHREKRVPLTGGIWGMALQKKKIILLKSLIESQPERDHIQDSSGKPVSQPLFAIPVLGRKGEVRMMITIEHIPFEMMLPERLRLLEIIADWASHTLGELEEKESVHKKLPIDPLTGLFQKAFFFRRAREELKKAQRYRLPLSLLEIDFYAEDPNSTLLLGHSYLEGLRDVLPQITRDTDVNGTSETGEKLWILLTVTDRDGAEIVADRFRRLFLERRVQNAVEKVGVRALVTSFSPREGNDLTRLANMFMDHLTTLERDPANGIFEATT